MGRTARNAITRERFPCGPGAIVLRARPRDDTSGAHPRLQYRSSLPRHPVPIGLVRHAFGRYRSFAADMHGRISRGGGTSFSAPTPIYLS